MGVGGKVRGVRASPCETGMTLVFPQSETGATGGF